MDELDRDYQFVFGSEEGQRVLRDLMLTSCVWGESTFDENPYVTARNEGRRTMVLYVLDRVRRKMKPQEFADEHTQALHDFRFPEPAGSRSTGSQ